MNGHAVSYFAKPDGYFDHGTEAFIQSNIYILNGSWVAKFVGIRNGEEAEATVSIDEFDEKEF